MRTKTTGLFIRQYCDNNNGRGYSLRGVNRRKFIENLTRKFFGSENGTLILTFLYRLNMLYV